jgi:hypothetical protein
MKLFSIILTSILVLSNVNGEKNLFDGKTLKGWNGDPKFWSVQNGSIVGQTTKENPTKGNTFIIWKGGKMKSGNSGIQYRSFVKPGKNDGWRIGGYQADFEAGDKFSGICYGEGFRGILSMRGQKTTLTVDDKGKLKKDAKQFGDSEEIGKAVKKGKWNQYRITAKGFQFNHYINGVKTTELIDNDEKTRRKDGLLAFQLHAGPPMKVYFKNIVLK